MSVKTSEAVQRKAVELRNNGMAYGKIAETLGLHISTVRLLYERHHEEFDSRPIQEKLNPVKRFALYSQWKLQ